MLAKYTDMLGNEYSHPVDLTGFSMNIEQIKNERDGLIAYQRINVFVQGRIQGTSQSDIDSKVNTLVAAYDTPGNKWEFKRDDGTNIGQSLIDTNLIGYIQPRFFAFPNSKGPQYATKRDYTISLEAMYTVAGAGNVLELRETLVIIGDGLAKNVVVPVTNGTPFMQTVMSNTPVFAQQRGFAIGAASYPASPGPLWARPIWDGDTSSETLITPERVNGGLINYRTEWNYNFSAISSLAGTPNV